MEECNMEDSKPKHWEFEDCSRPKPIAAKSAIAMMTDRQLCFIGKVLSKNKLDLPKQKRD